MSPFLLPGLVQDRHRVAVVWLGADCGHRVPVRPEGAAEAGPDTAVIAVVATAAAKAALMTTRLPTWLLPRILLGPAPAAPAARTPSRCQAREASQHRPGKR